MIRSKLKTISAVIFLAVFGCFVFTGSADAATSGVFTSQVISIGPADFSTFTWTDTTPAGTSVAMRVRAGNVITPDGTWTAWTSISKGGSLGALDNKIHIQYEATLSSDDGLTVPTLSDVTISLSMAYYSLISSPFNSEDLVLAVDSISWTESISGNSNILFQLRTSADGTTWTDWCGPDDGIAGCDTGTFFTDPAGGETIDAAFRDKSNDKYFQYKAYLGTDGTNNPVMSDITIGYTLDTVYQRAHSGTFTSQVIDAGESPDFTTFAWTETVPAGSSIAMRVRAGNVAAPDGTWIAWTTILKNGSLDAFDNNRYIQYEATLSSDDGITTPMLSDVTFNLLTSDTLISSPFILTCLNNSIILSQSS